MLNRMLGSGAPALLASAVLVALPVLGGGVLDAREYATWALVASISTVALVVDFGGPAFAVRESTRGNLTWQTLARASAMTAAGSLGVGFVAALVWPLYAAGSQFADAGWTGSLLFVLAALGSAVRGVLVVLSSALLSGDRHLTRGLLLLGQAVGQAALAVGLLAGGCGVWSLPVSACLSSTLALPFAMRAVRPMLMTTASPPGSARSFALAKGGVSLMGLSITQLDRWAVGAVATPSFLSSYDMLVRLGSLPRVAVIGLTGVLVVDGARGGDQDTRAALYARAVRVVAEVAALLSVGVLVLALALRTAGLVHLDGGEACLLFGIVLWYGVNAGTAPTSLLLTGAGRPAVELHYVVPAFVCTLLCWAAGLLLSSPLVMIIGSGTSLAGWSLWFLRTGRAHFCQEGDRHDVAEQRGWPSAALPGA